MLQPNRSRTVFNSDPCELKVSRGESGICTASSFHSADRVADFNSGIGIAEMLGQSNYLALVGAGRKPKFPQNKAWLFLCIDLLIFPWNLATNWCVLLSWSSGTTPNKRQSSHSNSARQSSVSGYQSHGSWWHSTTVSMSSRSPCPLRSCLYLKRLPIPSDWYAWERK